MSDIGFAFESRHGGSRAKGHVLWACFGIPGHDLTAAMSL